MLANTLTTPQITRAFTEGDCAFFAVALTERLNALYPVSVDDSAEAVPRFAVEFLCVSTCDDPDPDWFHAVVVEYHTVHDPRHNEYDRRPRTVSDIRGVFRIGDSVDMDALNFEYDDNETMLMSYTDLCKYYGDMPDHCYISELPNPEHMETTALRDFPATDLDAAVDNWVSVLAHRFDTTFEPAFDRMPVPT